MRILLLAALAAFTAGCVADASEPVAEARAPIVGGALDTFRSYVVGIGDADGVFCTGTVISRRTVLTAAHCFTEGKGATGGLDMVYFGSDVTKLQNGQPTVKAVRHPEFDPVTLSNDLTLVELAEDAPTQAAPLLRETMADTAEWVGPSFTFVGYGNDGHHDYGVRRAVSFPIDRVGPASDVGLDTHSGPIDTTQIYYRFPHENTCDGDSGGPAFVPRKHVERLAGVTSYGDQECLVDGVDARADAPAIAAFIQPTLDAFEGADPCRADGVCNESCNDAKTGTLGDPDCAEDHCGADGICVISCVDPPDPDCLPPSEAVTPGAGGGGGASGQPDTGTGGKDEMGGCHYSAAGGGERGPAGILLALGAIFAVRRRSR